jgi:hypothetical protein
VCLALQFIEGNSNFKKQFEVDLKSGSLVSRLCVKKGIIDSKLLEEGNN